MSDTTSHTQAALRGIENQIKTLEILVRRQEWEQVTIDIENVIERLEQIQAEAETRIVD